MRPKRGRTSARKGHMALRELLAFFRVDVDAKALHSVDAKLKRVKANFMQTAAAAVGFGRRASAGMAKSERAAGSLFTSIRRVGDAYLALQGVRELGALVNGFGAVLQAADDAAKGARRVGMSLEGFQTFQTFAQLSGGTAQGFENAAKRMSKAAFEVTQGLAEPKRAFKELGVEVVDSNDKIRDSGDIMGDVFRSLAQMESGTKRVALAQQVLGRSGVQVVAGLADGVAAYEDTIKVARELGVVFDESFARRAEAANDELLLMGKQMQRLKVGIVSAVLPSIRMAVARMTVWAQTTGDVIGQTVDLRGAVLSLTGLGVTAGLGALTRHFGGVRSMLLGGVNAAGKMQGGLLRMLNRVGGKAVVAAAAFLAIDDAIAFLQGRKSILGGFLQFLGFDPDKIRTELLANLEELSAWWDGSGRASFQRFAAAVGASAKSVLQGVGAFVKYAIGADVGISANESFVESFIGMRSPLFDSMDQVVDYIGDAWDGVVESARASVAEYYRIITYGHVAAAEGARDALRGIVAAADMAWQAIGAGAASLWASVVGFVVSAVGQIDGVLHTNLVGAVQSVAGGISGIFSGLWASVASMASASFGRILAAAADTIDAVVKFFKDPLAGINPTEILHGLMGGRETAAQLDQVTADKANFTAARRQLEAVNASVRAETGLPRGGDTIVNAPSQITVQVDARGNAAAPAVARQTAAAVSRAQTSTGRDLSIAVGGR